MEISPRPTHPLPPLAVDHRPAADALALARDPSPDLPLPLPPGAGMTGAAVSATLGSAHLPRVSAIAPAERTLKPYGIAMLPVETARAARIRPDEGPEPGQTAHRRDF